MRPPVRLFLAGTVLFWASLYVFVPTLPPYIEQVGGSLQMVGLVVGSYGLVQLLLRIPLGIWSDRAGRRKPFILAGFFFLVLGGVGLAQAGNAWGLLFSRALTGVSASTWVVVAVFFSSFYPPGQAVKAMSLITFCGGLSRMLSTYSGGLIAEAYGWTAPFYASAGLAVCGGLVMGLVGEQPRLVMPKHTTRSFKTTATRPLLLGVSLIAAMGQYATFVTVFGFTPVYAITLGASKAALGSLTLIGLLFQSLAALSGGTVMASRFGERATIALGFVVVALSTGLIPYLSNLSLLYLVQAMGGIGRGWTQPVLMGLALKAVSVTERGTAMGIFQAVYALGMFLGPALGGLLGDQIGLDGVFLSTGLLCLAASLASWRQIPSRMSRA